MMSDKPCNVQNPVYLAHVMLEAFICAEEKFMTLLTSGLCAASDCRTFRMPMDCGLVLNQLIHTFETSQFFLVSATAA